RVSSSTVRRWVKEGRLHSERVATPQGHAFRVYLDRGLKGVEPSVAPSDRPAPAGSTTAAVEGSTAVSTALSVERSEAMAAYNAALVAPLVAELAETRTRMLA